MGAYYARYQKINVNLRLLIICDKYEQETFEGSARQV